MSLSVLDLNGIPLYFGTVDKIPAEAEIVVDFRPTAETEAQLREEHIRHPCFDSYETSLRETFADLLKDCAEKIKNKKSIYLLDNSGAGNSAMTAWILTVRVLNIGRESGLNMVRTAYLQQPLEPKWRELSVPRFSRMYYFGEWVLMNYARQHYLQVFRKRQDYFIKMDSKDGTRGKVLTSQLSHQMGDGPQNDPILDRYKTINITTNKKCQWKTLHPDIIGPYNFPIITLENKSVYAVNLKNLIHAVSMYPASVDADDSLKANFTEDCVEIAKTWPNKEKRRTIKIKHPKSKEVVLKKSYPTYPKGNPPLCYFWSDKFMLEVEFRAYWSEIYEHLAVKTEAYKQLKDLVEDGTSLLISDYDGFNFIEEGMTLKELFEDAEKPWSFTHVLYGMLTGQRIWFDVSKTASISSGSDVESE